MQLAVLAEDDIWRCNPLVFVVMEAEKLFERLDKEFVNIDKIEDETFFYKGADVLVQSTWELPIIIQWPGSTLNWEFSTAQG